MPDVSLRRYPEVMEPDTSAPQQDDTFWDEKSQMTLRRSGVARWKQKLADRDQQRAARTDEITALRDRLRLGPAANARPSRVPHVSSWTPPPALRGRAGRSPSVRS